MAEAGFVVIAFDRSFQGASSGEPRSIEDPTQSVEDFRRVTDYLMTLPYVDGDCIGVLGICGGGGYAINATMTERRIKALGTVTAANYGRLMRGNFSGLHPVDALEKMANQRTAEIRGAKLQVDDLLPPSVEAGKKAVVGDKPGAFGAYRDGCEIVERAASKDKELVVAEGWSHYDLYDKPEPVKIALDKLIPFYTRVLGMVEATARVDQKVGKPAA